MEKIMKKNKKLFYDLLRLFFLILFLYYIFDLYIHKK